MPTGDLCSDSSVVSDNLFIYNKYSLRCCVRLRSFNKFFNASVIEISRPRLKVFVQWSPQLHVIIERYTSQSDRTRWQRQVWRIWRMKQFFLFEFLNHGFGHIDYVRMGAFLLKKNAIGPIQLFLLNWSAESAELLTIMIRIWCLVMLY